MVSAVNFCIAYVVVDVLCLVLTVIIASNVSRDSGSELQVRFFFFLLTANLVFVVFDAVWAILVFSGMFNPNMLLLSIVNGINVISVAFAGYFWFGFSLAYFDNPIMNRRSLRLATAIPAVLAIVFHVIGYYTNQNVIFTPEGGVAYGVMHTAVTTVPLVYLLAATVVALRKHRHSSTSAEKRMSLVFIFFMLPPAAAGVFDMLVPDMPVAAAGIMISIVFVIMAMQESRISIDALTGLNNRRRAESYLEECVLQASPENPLFLFIMDMNHFKEINDTYGHLEGDRALQMMANALRIVCAKLNVFAARWGGDEFVIVSTSGDLRDPEQVEQLLGETLDNLVRESHVPYKLSCATGYAKIDSPSQDWTALVLDADNMLYKRKELQRQ